MKDENKIRLDGLLDNLQAQLNYKYGLQTCRSLFGAWLCARKLPKLCKLLGCRPPSRTTIRYRLKNDGFVYLKPDEVSSFEKYAGYSMR